MKKKNRYLFSLLTGLSLAGIMQTGLVTVSAAPSLSASADASSVKKGDYVDISVDLQENPSISTLGASLNYDSSVLQYDSASWNGSFSGSDMQMASDTGSEVNLSVVCDDSYSSDGTVVTVRFQAVQDASSIPATLELRDMADADLSAVSDCKVTGSVKVPKTAQNKVNTEELKAAEETESKAAGQQQEVYVASTDTGSSQSTPQTASGEAQNSAVQSSATAGSSGVQNTSSKNVQALSSSGAGNTKTDQNYKTGIGLGNDIFLVFAAACGILALVFSVRKYKGEK